MTANQYKKNKQKTAMATALFVGQPWFLCEYVLCEYQGGRWSVRCLRMSES